MHYSFKNSLSLAFVISVFIIGFINIAKSVGANEKESNMAQKPIEEVLKDHSVMLMSIPGVVGTAQGLCDNKPCIKVYVVKRSSELEQKIPPVLEGYTVDIVETDVIKAY